MTFKNSRAPAGVVVNNIVEVVALLLVLVLVQVVDSVSVVIVEVTADVTV